MTRDTRRKMMDKVRAIMNRTTQNGCTEAEAMEALQKAQQLMAAYEIDEAELGATAQSEAAAILKRRGEDYFDIRKRLGAGVAKFTRTKIWMSGGHSAYDREFQFCGLESEAEFAMWLLDTLQAFVMRELKTFQADRKRHGLGNPRLVGSSFVYGCAHRIYERLCELAPPEPKTSNGNALVLSRNSLIAAKMRENGITLGRATKSRPTVNPAAYAAGMSAGNNARFDRPVGGAGGMLRIGGK